SNNIVGRLANTYGDIELDNVDVLLKFVSKAGGGNHLEIGTLYGGSAIAVALLKEELFQDGIVVCIDPLEGYYGNGDVSGVLVTPQILFHNIDTFEVGNRILVMKAKSQPCANLGIKFTTAYIDGDHKFEVPLMDWLCVKDVVQKYVIFDNCDDKHPAVQIACMVAGNDPEWKCVYDSGITYVVERI
ncbi:unnamed protein product, partial [marine sediment metagenome]